MVRNRDGPCDKDGDAERPVPVAKEAPGMDDIVGLGPRTSLDFKGDPRRPGCRFEKDVRHLGAGRRNVAYAHVATDPAAPGRPALHYRLLVTVVGIPPAILPLDRESLARSRALVVSSAVFVFVFVLVMPMAGGAPAFLHGHPAARRFAVSDPPAAP